MSKGLYIAIVLLCLVEVNCLRCYVCFACETSHLNSTQIQTCSHGKNYCSSTFAVKGNGLEITRQCAISAESGSCVNGTNYGICTCEKDECNNISWRVGPPPTVKTGGGGASATPPTEKTGGGGASAIHSTEHLILLLNVIILVIVYVI